MQEHPGLAEIPIYLDYNATTPVDPQVVTAMLPYLQIYFGNPASTHAYGQPTRQALAEARRQVSDLLACAPEEILFTAGGSESNNLAIRGIALGAGQAGGHLITQASEHPAVLNVCQALQRLHGFALTVLPVDASGQIHLADLEAAMRADTRLVSIMHANNETGTLQPLTTIAEIVHRRGALLHSDAAQTVGKVPVCPRELGVDLLTIAGHKLYAPRGIGALYVRHELAHLLEPLIYGGGQERGLRAGTENIAGIVALGRACELAAASLPESEQHLRQLRDSLHGHLEHALPGRVQLNGHLDQRLPNTLNVSIAGINAEVLLAATPGLACSTGSACHAGSHEPSPVLSAMGIPNERALAALRLSVGRWSSEAQLEQAVSLLSAAIRSSPPRV